MKKMSLVEMENTIGGVKCIYHYMGAIVLGLGGWIFGNGSSVIECWNGTHNEH
ncbi:hypothetical protein [Flavobacterium sp. UBA7663]|uniref:hypothetical protein n=1 Tax=Flavobacterium sp. UBA7663 TaxID=1946557 RepID=UPI0025C4226E|nr:hypothetical protein [Flavobacterium sp. UBA7663]